MTSKTNARIAGTAYLVYIVIGVPAFLLFNNATRGQDATARVAAIALDAAGVRVAIVLSLVTCFAALLLGVTLYALTREQDPDLAMMGLACRVSEGVLNAAIGVIAMVSLVWVGTSTTVDPVAARALGGFLFNLVAWNSIVGATFFGVGSTLFSWLLLRGRLIPAPLAWLGVVASILLVIVLPMQLAGFVRGPATQVVWIPMLVFELMIAAWLLVKGVAPRAVRQPA